MNEGFEGERKKFISKTKDVGYYPDRDVLGTGSDRTKVYQGFFQRRETAIKKIPRSEAHFTEREVKALCKQEAPLRNVVFCYWTSFELEEEDIKEKYHYLALELCVATLEDYICGKYDGPMPNDREALFQISCGIKSVHDQEIAHKDLRPQNILISKPDHQNRVTLKIADFGLSRNVPFGKEVTSTKNKGANGWLAPEVAEESPKVDYYKADIFSLGCIFHYFLAREEHPTKRGCHLFGEKLLVRQSKILHGKRQIDEKISYTSKCLIESMTDSAPSRRPTIDQVLLHPSLWSAEKVLRFLRSTSNTLEQTRKPSGPENLATLVEEMEKQRDEVVGGDFLDKLTSHVRNHINSHLQHYKILKKEPDYGTKVLNLLRQIRNLNEHFYELSPEVQSDLGGPEEGFYEYWMQKFPKLLIHTWDVMKHCNLSEIAKFYQGNENEEQLFASSPCSTRCTPSTSVVSSPRSPALDYSLNVSTASEPTSTSTPRNRETIADRLKRRAKRPELSVLANVSADDVKSQSVSRTEPEVNFGEPENGEQQGAEMEDIETALQDMSVNDASNPTVSADRYPKISGKRTIQVKDIPVKIIDHRPGFMNCFAVAMQDGSVYYHDQNQGLLKIRGPTGRNSDTAELCWNETGKILAAADRSGHVMVWNAVSNSIVPRTFPSTHIASVKWTNDRTDLLQILCHNKFVVLDSSGEIIRNFNLQQNCTDSCDWFGSEKFAVVVKKNFSLNVCTVQLGNGQETVRLTSILPGQTRVYSVKWHPKGQFIAMGYEDGKIRIWDLSEGTVLVAELLGHLKNKVHSLEWFCEDLENPGILVSCSYDNTAILWKPSPKWAPIRRLQFKQYISRMEYLPTARRLFISSFDRQLRVIDPFLNERSEGQSSDEVKISSEWPIWDFSICCSKDQMEILLAQKDGSVTALCFRL